MPETPDPERDSLHDLPRMTPEEMRETAASEGLMASEEETDPDYVDPEFVDPDDVLPGDRDRDRAGGDAA